MTKPDIRALATFGVLVAVSAPAVAGTDVGVRVEMDERSPRGPSLVTVLEPMVVDTTTDQPSIDGTTGEPAWASASWYAPTRSLRNEGPPDDGWSFSARITPGGLAVALRGLGPEATSTISVDPTGARLGWMAVTVGPQGATAHRCTARPEDARMPFPVAWKVANRPCEPARPAIAARGPDGWEILLPWTDLGTATDDLQIQWWVRDGEQTASFDQGRVAREYAGGARRITLQPTDGERSEGIYVAWDRGTETSAWTIAARGLTGPETWAWQVHYNGAPLRQGRVRLEPDGRGRATTTLTLPLQPHIATGMLAWQESENTPVVRGAHWMSWGVTERATLATPVHRGTLELRFDQNTPDLVTVLEARSLDGEKLLFEELALPAGEGRIFVDVPETWPDAIEIRLGHLFPEGWIPALRAGASSRFVGRR